MEFEEYIEALKLKEPRIVVLKELNAELLSAIYELWKRTVDEFRETSSVYEVCYPAFYEIFLGLDKDKYASETCYTYALEIYYAIINRIRKA